jgi:drug/metabolite transporter (DMT)-like permease
MTRTDPAERRLGHLYLTLAMVTVGSTVIASKLMAAGLPPFTATALRFAMALPLFGLIVLATRTPWPRLDRGTWGLLVVQAGAGSVGYTTLLIAGLTLTSAADAGVIIGTLPVVASLIAILILREKPNPRLLAAVALATAGVLVVSWPAGDMGAGSALGNALILGAVLCEGLFILLNKRLATPIAPLMQSTLMTGLGLVVAAVPAFAFEQPFTLALDRTAVLATAYYAAIPTVAGFLLWYAGAARVSGSEASLFTAVAPVSAVLMAGLVLGEAVTPTHGIGMACVLVAVIGVALTPHKPTPGHRKENPTC